MSTGAQHFDSAERLLAEAQEIPDAREAALQVARALVHGVLSLAAATAFPRAKPGEYGRPAGGQL